MRPRAFVRTVPASGLTRWNVNYFAARLTSDGNLPTLRLIKAYLGAVAPRTATSLKVMEMYFKHFAADFTDTRLPPATRGIADGARAGDRTEPLVWTREEFTLTALACSKCALIWHSLTLRVSPSFVSRQRSEGLPFQVG